MSLTEFIRKTQLLLQHGIHESRQAIRSLDEFSAMPVDAVALEERILMSATPVASVAPAVEPTAASPVESTAPIFADSAATDQDFNDAGLDASHEQDVRDVASRDSADHQRLPDAIADSVLPPADVVREIAPQAQTTELIFVDAGVENFEQLVLGFESQAEATDRNVEVIVLDADRNGLAQITKALLGRNQIDSLQIVSHGQAGEVQLGRLTLSLDNFDIYRSTFAAWQGALSAGADLLFYGCDLAATDNGRLLMDQISDACGCDVAASTDVTGHASLGGDWDLEYRVGEIESLTQFDFSTLATWYGTLDITSDLQAHYTFDTDASDSSGNGHNGTLAANATINTDAGTNQIGGGKLLLDGTTDRVILNAHAASFAAHSEGTVAAWVRTTSLNEGTIFDLNDGVGNDFAAFWVQNGNLHWLVSEAGTPQVEVSSTATVDDGNWHHVAVAVSASGTRLFIDGTELTGADRTFGSGSATSTNYFADLAGISASNIGAYNMGGVAGELDGMLDDVRVYDRALSAADIQELYGRDGTPYAIQTTQTVEGGLSLNTNGGTDAVLIADTGFVSSVSNLTFEVQFSGTDHGGETSFVSYFAGGAEDFEVEIENSTIPGSLELSVGGVSVESSAMDYRTLLDGTRHSLAVTWSSAAGNWQIFVDGSLIDSGSGLHTAGTVSTNGSLVFGQDQDSSAGNYNPTQYFSGTYYDARFFYDVRTAAEIAAHHTGDVPHDEHALLAHWDFSRMTTDGVVPELAFGTNLTVSHVTGSGFTEGNAELSLSVNEHAAAGTVVGQVTGHDADREALIASLLASDPTLTYSSISDKFYRTVTTASTWSNAATAAQAASLNGAGGQLATIRSAAENEVVAQMAVNAAQQLWLGASDATSEGRWRWQQAGADADQFWSGDASGGSINNGFTDWQSGRPDNSGGTQHYLLLQPNGEWNDESDGTAGVGYIVEWDADEVLDGTQTLTYSLAYQSVAGAFAINADTGQITVADGALLDYEAAANQTLTVRIQDPDGQTFDRSVQVEIRNINEASATLWLNTQNTTTNGAAGLSGWTEGQLLEFGGSAPTYESGGTTGEFSVRFDLDAWVADGSGRVNALHYVTRALEVGSGAAAFSLQAGDLLFSTAANETVGGIAVGDEDILVFRPDSLGDWSSGTFSRLVEGSQIGLTDVQALTLVEQSITVGGQSLTAGDLLIADDAMDVSLLQLTGTGAATAGTESLFLDGTAMGITGLNRTVGLQLIDAATVVGDEVLNAGELLITLTDAEAAFGSGPTIAVDPQDILRLSVSSTGVTTNVTALAWFDGSDVGLNTNEEDIHALTLMKRQLVPVLTLPGSGLNYTAGDPASVIDATATVSDPDSNNLSGGTLTVTFTANGTANDRLAIESTGTGAGQISTVSNVVRYEGTSIGTFTGGTDGSTPLTVTFNANATPAAAQALARSITYRNVAVTPTFNSRTVSFQVTDGDGGSSQAATQTITVSALNTNPVITSNGGGATAAVNVAENNTAVTTVTATDADLPAQTLSYSITGGTDAARFSIDSGSGALTFATAPDFESPTDSNTDNVYQVTVQVSDGAGGTDTQTINVTVTGTNDNAPIITSNGGGATASVNVAENSTAVTTVTATDADLPAQTLSYGITGGTDAARFSIDSGSGALTFTTAPDFESPADANTDNVYEVTVQVSDGAGGTDTQTITVTVTGTNDNAPIITSNGGGATAAMNVVSNTTAVTTIAATDADLPAQTLTYSIIGGTDAARFSIDNGTGALSFTTAPDFNSPTDANTDNVYEVTVQASDGAGGTDTQTIDVTVTNSAPTDLSTGISINTASGNDVYLEAADGGNTLNSLTAVTVEIAFRIDTPNTAKNTLLSYSQGFNHNELYLSVRPDGRLHFAVDSFGSGELDSTVAYPQLLDGQVHHVAVTWDSATGTVLFYVDGVQSEPAATYQAGRTISGGGTLQFGQDQDLTGYEADQAFLGSFHDIRIWDHVRSGAEIALHHEYQFDDSSLPTGLLANWQMKQLVSATTIADVVNPGTNDLTVGHVGAVTDFTPGTATDQWSVQENAANGTFVATVRPTDPDVGTDGSFTFALTAGGDAGGRFSINAATGALSVADGSLLDFESATSHTVTVRVTDADGQTFDKVITLYVTDVNDAPALTSNGGGATAAVNVAEGNTAVTTVTATDADLPAQTLSYSITGGTDAARFSIDSASGALTFASAPDFEAPADANTDNVYEVTVQVSDGAGGTDTQTISVTVTATNDNAPIITSNGGGATAAVSVAENNTAVTTVLATDADLPAQTLSYSITGGTDAARFSIDSVTGALSFATAPDFEAPADANTDNVYEVIVQASDGAGGTDTQTISVTVTNTSDNAPVITSNGGGATAAVNVAENNTAVTTVTATDADLPAQTLSYSITGGTDAARFTIDSATGTLSFATAPDFEAPTDANGDNIYEVTVQASDGAGGTDTQTISVTVTNTNDNVPVITSNGGGATAAVNVAENNTAVTTVTATDADLPAQTLSYSITGGTDAARFTIDSASGALSFATAPDFESPTDANGDNIYEVTVQASDGAGGTDTQAISVTITGTNDNAPVITSNGGGATAAVDVAENNTAVTTVTATDADLPIQTLSYSITGGTDAARFTIDSASGALSFATAPDFETPTDANSDNIYEVSIQASDGAGGTDTQTVSVTVTDANEFPVSAIADTNSAANQITENGTAGQSVGITAFATDADGTTNSVSYALTNDAGGRFAIDAVSGVVTTTGPLDFEATGPLLSIIIQATSTDGSTSNRSFGISILNQNEAPSLSAFGPYNVNENSANGTVVGSVVAGDPDVGDVLSYSISGTTAFAVDSASGIITVSDSTQLDHEASSTISFTVSVTDASGLTDSRTTTVAITDLNETPTTLSLTGGTIDENSPNGSLVATLSGTDPDAGDTLSFSLSNNAGGRFNVDSVTGEIRVADSTGLNFEQDSSHVITAEVTDTGGLSRTQTFTITVNDVNEQPLAIGESFDGRQLQPVTASAGELLTNDSDPDGDVLSVVLATGPSNGSLLLNADGSFTYTPTGTFNGTDEFSYRVTDGALDSDPVTVTLEIAMTISGVSGSGSTSGNANNNSSSSSDSSISIEVVDSGTAEADSSSTDSDTATTEEFDQNQDAAVARAAGAGTADTAQAASGFAAPKVSDQIVRRTSSEQFVAIFLDAVPEEEVTERDGNNRRGREDELRSENSATESFLFAQAVVSNPLFDAEFDTRSNRDYVEQMREEEQHALFVESVVIGSSAAVSTSVSVGYVVWLLRGGSLLTTFLSSLPAWQSFDPLPVLEEFNEDEDDGGESLEELVG